MFRSSRIALALLAFGAAAANAVEPIVVDDSQLKARSTTIGGASVLPTTRTIPHWFGQTTDPTNGVTYGYNMPRGGARISGNLTRQGGQPGIERCHT